MLTSNLFLHWLTYIQIRKWQSICNCFCNIIPFCNKMIVSVETDNDSKCCTSVLKSTGKRKLTKSTTSKMTWSFLMTKTVTTFSLSHTQTHQHSPIHTHTFSFSLSLFLSLSPHTQHSLYICLTFSLSQLHTHNTQTTTTHTHTHSLSHTLMYFCSGSRK